MFSGQCLTKKFKNRHFLRLWLWYFSYYCATICSGCPLPKELFSVCGLRYEFETRIEFFILKITNLRDNHFTPELSTYYGTGTIEHCRYPPHVSKYQVLLDRTWCVPGQLRRQWCSRTFVTRDRAKRWTPIGFGATWKRYTRNKCYMYITSGVLSHGTLSIQNACPLVHRKGWEQHFSCFAMPLEIYSFASAPLHTPICFREVENNGFLRNIVAIGCIWGVSRDL